MVTTLKGPVGLRWRKTNVANYSTDQEKVVKLLTSIPESEGGQRAAWNEMPPLIGADGNCTGKLVNAIWNFQEFWQARGVCNIIDGVVDPGGRALIKMNQLGGPQVRPEPKPTGPHSAREPFMERVYAVVPTALAWRDAADRVLTCAGRALQLVSPSLGDAHALALVNRCFKVNEPGRTLQQANADINSIKRVFGEIRQFLIAVQGGAEYLLPGDPASEATAYTWPGHWANKNPKDGIWFVKKQLEGKDTSFVVDAMMHECAHFCGPMGPGAIDHAKVNGDPAYGDLALGLSRAECLINASSYAWLAYLAPMPPNRWLVAT